MAPTIGRDVVLDDLCRKAEAMEEAKDQRRDLGVRLNTKPALEGTHIIKGFVDDREADDRIDDVAINSDVKVDAE